MTAAAPVSIYIHIPFCTVKCGYCDFNAYAGLDGLRDVYAAAVVAEIRHWRAALEGRTVATIAFGGGTPGEMPASEIAAILDAVRAVVPVAPGAEVGLEANPGTSGGHHLSALREAGVSRISFGAQSFDPGELRFLDRIHSPEAIEAAVRLARAAGFESLNLDLIYGLPGQQPDAWQWNLDRALALEPDHLSCYALTVEEATPLGHRVARGQVVPLEDDLAAAMYDQATEALASAGLIQYELSNWAMPGHQSRHNRVYWTDGEYVGIGAGAHGYFGGERYENVAHPRHYIERMEATHTGDARPALLRCYVPDEETAMFDWLSLRLRLLEGFEPASFASRFGRSLEDVVGPVLASCEAAGVLARDGRVRLTQRGRLLHGELSAQILAHLGRPA